MAIELNLLHDAATHARRDVKVGMGAKVNTLLGKAIPSLGDKMAAKQADRQQHDEPPRNPMGTLYVAGELLQSGAG